MTKDEEKLRKFLESDDPAMVLMGLSMAKGSGVPDDLLGLVAGLYMWHEDKTVRAAAKSTFTKHAPAELKRILRENWKAQYRTISDWDYCCTIVDGLFKHFKKTQLHGIDIWSQAILRDSKGYTQGIFTGVIERFDTVTELKSALSKRGLPTSGSKIKLRERLEKAGLPTVPSLFFRAGPDFAFALARTGDIRGIQSIIDSLGEASASGIESTAKVLKELGGPAIDMCNQTLQDGLVKTRAGVIGALTIIGGEQAIIPIMDALANKSVRSSWADISLYIDIEDEGINAAENLGKIGGKKAVAPLLKMLNDSKASVRYMSAEALGETGDKRAVEPLIKLLKVSTKGSTDVREAAAKALGKIGDSRMKAPLLKMLEGINANKLKNKRNDKDEEARMKGIEALLNCNIKKEQDVITVLTAYVQFYGLSNSHGYEFNVLHSKFTSWFAELEPKYLEKLFIAANSMGKSTNYGKYGVITKKEENDYYDIWGCADENFSEIIQEFGEKAIDPLIDILGNKDYHYHLHKKAAVELGKLGAYGAGEVLTKAFEAYSEDYPASDVHKAAAKALKKIKYTGKTVMLKKFLDCTDSKKAKAILEKLEDWMLAGLVVWGEVNKTQKNWITKKLLTDPKEAFLKYWVDIKIPEDSILIKTGHFEDFSSPKIQASKRPTGCRGRHQWPNKQMKRGDVRLSIRLPNPDNPYYIGKDWDPYTGRPTSGSYQKENLVTYYFCAKCSSEYVDYKKRYETIEDWWFRSLNSEKAAIEAQIIEQKKKEAEKARKIAAKKAEKEKLASSGPINLLADKIVKSKWGGAAGDKTAMKKMAASMKKGEVSSEILEEVLWTYMFHEDNGTRAVAKKAFMETASEDSINAVKKNWKASFRKGGKLTKNLAKLEKSLSNTKLNFTNLLIKVLGDYEDPPHYLYYKSPNYNTKEDRYPIIDALGIIGDAQAAGPLGQFMVTSLSVRYSDWKVNAIPTITSSLVKFGEPAIAPLVEALKCASDCRKGVEQSSYYLRGKSVARSFTTSAEIIAKALTKLKWKPETDELLALQLIAMGKWSDCVKLGAPAVGPMIKKFGDRGEAQYSIVKTLGKIGDARAVRALTNPEFFGSSKWWEWGNLAPDIFETLGKINDVSVISTLLKTLEEVNKRTPEHDKCKCFHCRPFSIEELGLAEYYANGILKEKITETSGHMKPAYKGSKIYGVVSQEASAAIIKILSKFEKSIMKNYTNGDTDFGPLLSGKLIERKWLAIILQKIANKKLKGEEKKNVLRFLESKDPAMVQMGASLLKGALE